MSDETTTIAHIQALSPELVERMVNAIPPRHIALQCQKIDRRIHFRYFKGYRPEKVSRKQVAAVVQKEVVQGESEAFAELIALAWNATQAALHEAMRANVAEINPNVEEIERIEDAQAFAIVTALAADFEREDIYLCTMLNEVRFTPEYKERMAAALADETAAWPPEVAAVTPESAAGDEPEE